MMSYAPPLDGNPCLTLFNMQVGSGTAICGKFCVPRTYSFYRLQHVRKAASSGTRGLLYTGLNCCDKSVTNSIFRLPPLREASSLYAGTGRMFQSMVNFQRFAINATAPEKGFEGTCGVPKYEEESVGVLLLNLGGPDTLDDVQPFLYNLFADPDIIRLPRLLRFFQRPLAQLISVLRAPKSMEGYAAIGGGSPLRKITEEQAGALREALEENNTSAKVYVGMRYWHPYIEDAVKRIKKDRITRLVVLPLYPQFSISTSGSSLRLLEEIFRDDEYLVNMPHTVIPSWYQREGYVKAMSDLIDKELKNFKEPNEVVIFFSAHGVPCPYVEKAGDPYKDEMECCVKLVMTELRLRGLPNKHILAYQSRVGPTEWLKPYTDDSIKELGQKGVKSLLAVPISFVSEHIETLEEIDVEYRGLALESGITNWGRVPALGCEQTFISDLADAIIEALPHVRAMAVSDPEAHPVWTISRTLQNYFQPYGGRAWMEWLSGG